MQQFNDKTAELEVRWSDDHQSIHNIDWLKRRQFNESAKNSYLQTDFRPERQQWRKEDFEVACKTFEYEELIETDKGAIIYVIVISPLNGS